MRILCVTVIAILAFTATAQYDAYGAWNVDIQTDLFTDVRQATMLTQAIQAPSTNRHPFVVVRCGFNRRLVEILILFDEYIGSDDLFRGAWRFQNDEPNFDARFIPTGEGDVAFLGNLDATVWLTEMQEEGALAIRVYDYNNNRLDYQFDLTGFNDAWAALGCQDAPNAP